MVRNDRAGGGVDTKRWMENQTSVLAHADGYVRQKGKRVSLGRKYMY
jgi:hypothetical protein